MKNSTLTFSLFFSLVLLASCNKDGAMGEVNFGKLEGKTWVADRTAYLFNGQETYSVPQCDLYGIIEKIYFSGGNATVYMNASPYVYPYSIIDGDVNIATLWGSAITFTPVKLTNKELIAEQRERYVLGVSKYGSHEITKIEIEPVEIANVNGTAIYDLVYRYKSESGDDKTYLRETCFYYDNNRNRVECYYSSSTSLTDFYRALDKQTLTREELLLIMRGIITSNMISHANYSEDVIVDCDKLIEAVEALGYTEEQSLLLLYEFCDNYNPIKKIMYHDRLERPSLTKDYLITCLFEEGGSLINYEGNSWEIEKIYYEKNTDGYWCDGISRYYFTAQ